MDESVQKELAKLDPTLLERLKNGKSSKERRYAWKFWGTERFCISCLWKQPLTFEEVLRSHGFFDTGISMDEKRFKPNGRPFPLDKEE